MYQYAVSEVPGIRSRWRAVVENPAVYREDGCESWGLSFVRRRDGSLSAEVSGPSPAALSVSSRIGESYWGVELAPEITLAGVDKASIIGHWVTLPVQGSTVMLGGTAWRFPSWELLEDFVVGLDAAGMLAKDEHVHRALVGDDAGYSKRTWQRRFRATTGMTQTQIRQVRRARRAYGLLQRGHPPVEVAVMCGYSDQAHMTRSLRRACNTTPGRIRARSDPSD